MGLESTASRAGADLREHEHLRGLLRPKRRQRARHPIGDVIVSLGFASRAIVDEAVAESREAGRTTGQILIESGELTQQQLAIALGERLGIDYVDLSLFEIDMGAVA